LQEQELSDRLLAVVQLHGLISTQLDGGRRRDALAAHREGMALEEIQVAARAPWHRLRAASSARPGAIVTRPDRQVGVGLGRA
jgi:hypothetical protein